MGKQGRDCEVPGEFRSKKIRTDSEGDLHSAQGGRGSRATAVTSTARWLPASFRIRDRDGREGRHLRGSWEQGEEGNG